MGPSKFSNELEYHIADWMRTWDRIFQNQPELRSLVKDTPLSERVSFRGLNALKKPKKEVICNVK